MASMNRSSPFQPDLYPSMHHPSVKNGPPHIGQLGRADSSGSSGDIIMGGTPLYDHHSGRHVVPQIIGSSMHSSPPIFRTPPPPGYVEYPYNTFNRSGPAPVQPIPAYSFYPHPHPPQIWSSFTPPSYVTVEYITDLGPNDVLSGRGGATNSYKGNRSFRFLVKEYQGQYLQAKKRDKPAVASIIVDLIRKKGGRFLRRCDDKHNPQGNVLWVDIGDDRAREKTVCVGLFYVK